MNNDIKEILDIERYRNKDGYVENISLLPREFDKLLDYITNLQEENKRLNSIINKFEAEIELELTIDEKDALLEHNTFITINDTLKKVLKRIKELKEGK